MSEENRVDELAKETPEDTTPKSPEDTTEDVVEEQQPDASEKEVDYQAKLEEVEARLQKAQRTNENYVRELKKYRKQALEDSPGVTPKSDNPQVEKIRENFASKKADVLEEFSDEINNLSEEQFSKVKRLIKSSMDSVYSEAVNQNRYVAQGELQKSIQELIAYAKGPKVSVDPSEVAKRDMAEISGIKSKSKTRNVSATEVDKQMAEQTGRTPEQERDIRLKREERLKDYQVNKYL